MTRRANPPAYSSITLDKVYGMSQDRAGVELDDREFTDIVNWRNNNLEGFYERPGSVKVFNETHTGSATGVNGLHTFIDDSGTETYIKLDDSGNVYKTTGGSWTQITASAPTFADANTFIVTMNTKNTGGSSDVSGTTTSADTTSVTDTAQSQTVNARVGSVLTVNNEIKLVTGNTGTQFFIAERFDETPSSDSFTIVARAQEFFIANGTQFYKCDGTTFTRLDTSTFAYAFTGIEAHQNRLFGWSGSRLHWSDVGVGEHFSRNAWRDFTTPIQRVKSIGNVLIIYEKKRVTAMFGDNPDNFFFQPILDGVGTSSPKSVANYHGLYQFFIDDNLGVVVLSTQSLRPSGEADEPFSVSRDYINNLILTQTSANLHASCAEVDEDHLHICIDDDWYVLNIKASSKMGFKKWIWTRDSRPSNNDANVLGHFGTKFVSGPQDTGQVYEIENGSDDAGTAISSTIEKQDWNPGNTPSRKKFYALRVVQPIAAASSTMNFFADPDGSTYGSSLSTIDLNAASTSEHRYLFTGNPSDVKDTGRKISFKLTNTDSNQPTEIEQIELLFIPGLYE